MYLYANIWSFHLSHYAYLGVRIVRIVRKCNFNICACRKDSFTSVTTRSFEPF